MTNPWSKLAGRRTTLKAAKSTRRANGTARIQHSSYATVNGYTKNNSWWDLHAQVKKRCGGYCEVQGCSNKMSEPHHIIPLSKGGTNTLTNLVGLCKSCHDKRHTHLFRARSKA
ncbi:HNH endonuclease [Achromobacter phage Motura]|uniref:HNH endonuclease n=1 Tax=Achromobacter phage Motura TaxID=2591403 RepID=A0A514CSZ8_9CAUD|nr:HNH endonuclease [Achromobacter phage Motura]QDH83609.1 HNH endonuclease [Achromobacter phage Motura]